MNCRKKQTDKFCPFYNLENKPDGTFKDYAKVFLFALPLVILEGILYTHIPFLFFLTLLSMIVVGFPVLIIQNRKNKRKKTETTSPASSSR